jgi:hypothetical protein
LVTGGCAEIVLGEKGITAPVEGWRLAHEELSVTIIERCYPTKEYTILSVMARVFSKKGKRR